LAIECNNSQERKKENGDQDEYEPLHMCEEWAASMKTKHTRELHLRLKDHFLKRGKRNETKLDVERYLYDTQKQRINKKSLETTFYLSSYEVEKKKSYHLLVWVTSKMNDRSSNVQNDWQWDRADVMHEILTDQQYVQCLFIGRYSSMNTFIEISNVRIRIYLPKSTSTQLFRMLQNNNSQSK
jgi:hypothetical protein